MGKPSGGARPCARTASDGRRQFDQRAQRASTGTVDRWTDLALLAGIVRPRMESIIQKSPPGSVLTCFLQDSSDGGGKYTRRARGPHTPPPSRPGSSRLGSSALQTSYQQVFLRPRQSAPCMGRPSAGRAAGERVRCLLRAGPRGRIPNSSHGVLWWPSVPLPDSLTLPSSEQSRPQPR